MCGIGFSFLFQNEQTRSNAATRTFSCKCSDINKRLQNNISFRGPDLPLGLKQQLITSSSCIDIDDVHCKSDKNDDEANTGDNSNSKMMLLTLFASVLHMQGENMIPQPLEYHLNNYDIQNNIYHEKLTFCWNGEAYYIHQIENYPPYFDIVHKNGTAQQVIEETIQLETTSNNNQKEQIEMIHQSDTKIVLDYIVKNAFCHNIKNDSNYSKNVHISIANALSSIKGEYSFILHHQTQSPFHEKKAGCIYFGRDPLGRRSLLMSKVSMNENNNNHNQDHDDEKNCNDTSSNSCFKDIQEFIVSSVGLSCDLQKQRIIHDSDSIILEEIPAGRLYCLNLDDRTLTYEKIPKQNDLQIKMSTTNTNSVIYQQQRIEEAVDITSLNIQQASDKLHEYLNHAIHRRVIDAPTTCSGNSTKEKNNYEHETNIDDIDKEEDASVAILFSGGVDSVIIAALCHNYVPEHQPIDLINVAFANTGSLHNNNHAASNGTSTSKLSKGLNAKSLFEASPDRQAALLSYQEMKLRWPKRKWRFISVNVDYEEVLDNEKIICALMSPLSSTMDFNIATAFWFASRGRGFLMNDNVDNNDLLMLNSSCSNDWKPATNHLRFCNDKIRVKEKRQCSMKNCEKVSQFGCIFESCKFCCGRYHRPISQFIGGRASLCSVHSNDNSKRKTKKNVAVNSNNKIIGDESKKDSTRNRLFTSNAKVILIGIGADELMAGYGRHRTAYIRGGYDALRKELAMEKDRLWTRNLGRDDRCISYHGKEARFPFLDEDLVAFLNSLDVEQLCDMTKPPGKGDKMILRLVAEKIGVTQCSGLVKRAIQFGSRIAKVSDAHRFGSSNKASGSANHIKTLS